MKVTRNRRTKKWIFASGLATLLAWSECPAGEPPAAAVLVFNHYVVQMERRLDAEHHAASELHRRGKGMSIERVDDAERESAPGAMIHHWRGSAFAAGGKAADFERVMHNFGGYSNYFAPEVLRAKVLSRHGDTFAVSIRVRQKHIITVVMDISYDVNFDRLDAHRGWSTSRSTRSAEITGEGTAGERALSSEEEHGFIWRQNTYWTYEERDGGLYLQLESVSMSRAIPKGLAWAVQPFVETVPRESLEFTLQATCDAIARGVR